MLLIQINQIRRSPRRVSDSRSSSKHTPNGRETINLDEVNEEDDEGYKSYDNNDDGHMLKKDDDYNFRTALHNLCQA